MSGTLPEQLLVRLKIGWERIQFFHKHVQIVEKGKTVILFTNASGKQATLEQTSSPPCNNLTNPGLFGLHPETGDKFGQREARYRQVRPIS
jgi:hypothetical protein